MFLIILKINKEKKKAISTKINPQTGVRTDMCEAKTTIADKPARKSRLKTYKRIGRLGKVDLLAFDVSITTLYGYYCRILPLHLSC